MNQKYVVFFILCLFEFSVGELHTKGDEESTVIESGSSEIITEELDPEIDSKIIREVRDVTSSDSDDVSALGIDELQNFTWIPDINNADTVTKLPLDYYEGSSVEDADVALAEAVHVPPSHSYRKFLFLLDISQVLTF